MSESAATVETPLIARSTDSDETMTLCTLPNQATIWGTGIGAAGVTYTFFASLIISESEGEEPPPIRYWLYALVAIAGFGADGYKAYRLKNPVSRGRFTQEINSHGFSHNEKITLSPAWLLQQAGTIIESAALYNILLIGLSEALLSKYAEEEKMEELQHLHIAFTLISILVLSIPTLLLHARLHAQHTLNMCQKILASIVQGLELAAGFAPFMDMAKDNIQTLSATTSAAVLSSLIFIGTLTHGITSYFEKQNIVEEAIKTVVQAGVSLFFFVLTMDAYVDTQELIEGHIDHSDPHPAFITSMALITTAHFLWFSWESLSNLKGYLCSGSGEESTATAAAHGRNSPTISHRSGIV